MMRDSGARDRRWPVTVPAKRLDLERGLARASGLAGELVDRQGMADLGRRRPAAGGVEEGEFGGELDAAATAGVQARVGDIGADVVVVGFVGATRRWTGRESERLEIAIRCLSCRFPRCEELASLLTEDIEPAEDG
jgi:hypothetical protein